MKPTDAYNTIVELLWNINKWYLTEYEKELDTIRDTIIEKERLEKQNEALKNQLKEAKESGCIFILLSK